MDDNVDAIIAVVLVFWVRAATCWMTEAIILMMLFVGVMVWILMPTFPRLCGTHYHLWSHCHHCWLILPVAVHYVTALVFWARPSTCWMRMTACTASQPGTTRSVVCVIVSPTLFIRSFLLSQNFAHITFFFSRLCSSLLSFMRPYISLIWFIQKLLVICLICWASFSSLYPSVSCLDVLLLFLFHTFC